LDELGLVVVKALRRNTMLFAGAALAVVTSKIQTWQHKSKGLGDKD
jgi:hypothetical protein